ncbi:MAG: hypothetical protein LBG99_05920 [Propionibacteriaceae bacterium]|jgi:hypothetical protein|nr:hypothetical protein [Propionibacteriaceae bacterium]
MSKSGRPSSQKAKASSKLSVSKPSVNEASVTDRKRVLSVVVISVVLVVGVVLALLLVDRDKGVVGPGGSSLTGFLDMTISELNEVLGATPEYGDYLYLGAAVPVYYESLPLTLYAIDTDVSDGAGPMTGDERICIAGMESKAGKRYTLDGTIPVRTTQEDIESTVPGGMYYDPNNPTDYGITLEFGGFTYEGVLEGDLQVRYSWYYKPSPRSVNDMVTVWSQNCVEKVLG